MSDANHGFTLHSVELEHRDGQVITRSRPLNIHLPADEPILNPRGVMLERGAGCLERGLATMVALTHGRNASGEPTLDYLGYIGPDNVAEFVNVQPSSLYNMSDALFTVSVVQVHVSDLGYSESTEGNDVLFLVTREGVLKPFEQAGAVLWPKELLEVIQDSQSQRDQRFRMATAGDVQLDTLYYRRHLADETGVLAHGTTYDCFVVCRADDRFTWLEKAKHQIRHEIEGQREGIQQQLNTLDNALKRLT